MKPTITENKKSILTDYLHQLEDELSELSRCIEEDTSIPEDQFRMYEKRIQQLYSVYNQLNEEITFS